MDDIQTKAQELATLVMNQISEARQELADKMLELGYTKETHRITDNYNDVIEDPTIPYKCYAEPIPRFN
jgi:hypothetical protein